MLINAKVQDRGQKHHRIAPTQKLCQKEKQTRKHGMKTAAKVVAV